MKQFLFAWITGLGNQKLAISWIMCSLALLLHIVLSMTACSYMISFLHLFGLTFCQAFQKNIIVSERDLLVYI